MYQRKQGLFVILFFLIAGSSFAQFSDTSALNAYIRDTIRDRRPDKVTAAQLQRGLLGIVKLMPVNTPLNSGWVGYGSSSNILKGNSAFTFNDITNTLYSDTFTTKRLNVINSPGGTEYTRINYNTLNITHNSGNDNVISITSNSNSFKRLNVTNTSTGSAAGAGALYLNDAGTTLQYYVGSTGNAFVPNGVLFRTNGPGGLNIVADLGPIAFGKHAGMGVNELARFTTNGRLGIGTKTPEQKLHIAGQIKIDSILTGSSTDSILTTSNGLVKKVASDRFIQTDRVFKVYPWDYHNDTLDFELYGWNAEYNPDPTYAPSILATVDIEITVTSGTPSGTVISAIFEGQTVYTLTVTGTAATDYYVIGSIKISQDIKYPYIYYIKGAAETINGAGIVSTTNTAYRFDSDSFINPMIEFGTNSSSLARIGCTYTVDKKQQGRWIYTPGPGGGAGTF